MSGALIIPLSFHVDYWDYLGWKDPFASHAHAERQQTYNHALRDIATYTPQMVVDGTLGFIGSDGRAAEKAVADAAKRTHLSVVLQRAGNGLKVAIPTADTTADLLLIICEGNLGSSVLRGENAGHRLRHTAVVRSLKVVARLEAGQAYQADPAPTLQGLAAESAPGRRVVAGSDLPSNPGRIGPQSLGHEAPQRGPS